MPVICHKYGLAFYSVPKIACTSVKRLLYYMEHGQTPHDARAGKDAGKTPITLRGETGFDADEADRLSALESFTIVRDPIKRFLSAYANRVRFHGELDQWRVNNGSLTLRRPSRPSLAEFVDYLEDYRADSQTIRHHTQPMTYFLGSDLGRYDHVFKMEDLESVTAFLSDRSGQPLTLPHKQKGGPRLTPEDLSDKHLTKIRDYYAADYTLLQGYYA